MKQVLIFFLLLSITTKSFSQYSSDVSAAYIFGKLGGFDGTQDFTGTFFAGMNWYKKLSKKNYAVSSVHAVTGLRLSRSGYKMHGYEPFPNQAYYNNYGVTHMESSLMQHFVTIPVGFDFQFRQKPVTSPGSFYSVKLLLNNSILLYSVLKESVVYDSNHKTNVTSYASKYVPGFTVETRFVFLVAGLTWQKVGYKIPDGKLNLDEGAGSPFYEVFSKSGKYNDLYLYLGIVVNLKNELKQHAK